MAAVAIADYLDLAVGDKIRYLPKQKLFYVRGLVDGQYVLRTWSSRRQTWIYTVEPPEHFSAQHWSAIKCE